ncbi:unnamed protein product, partial [Prunus brigantina]
NSIGFLFSLSSSSTPSKIAHLLLLRRRDSTTNTTPLLSGFQLFNLYFNHSFGDKPRYRHVKQINLEFAQDIEDKHLVLIKNKVCQVNRFWIAANIARLPMSP